MTDDAGISMRPNQGAGRAGRCGGGGEREHDVGGAALEEGACAGRCRSSCDHHGNGLVAREADGGAPAALAGAPDSDADMLACARAPAATCRCS